MPFGSTHQLIVLVARSAVNTFFRTIEVHGAENVPEDVPIIFACSHANMAVDPAILSSTLPRGFKLHYWVKDSLFKNPALGALLRNAGNIAVDRKNKNNQKLFRGTFEALALNESIGVFPEGTSHTEPHIIPIKDGTAWAALEYVRYLAGTQENGGPKKGKRAVVLPVGIAYVDKAKYRSRATVQYGLPISMDDYDEDFMAFDESRRRLAVKRLTRRIELDFRQMTVNAPDWDTAFAAKMARQLLWEREEDLLLKNYVEVSQTLVDLFTTRLETIDRVKALLVTYHKLLISSRLSNEALTDLPLPQTLDPTRKASLPSRFSTLYMLTKDSITCLIRLPFFLIPMLVHIPVYIFGILGARLVEDELETHAQMKIALGLLLSFLTYPVLFFTIWAIIRQVPLGGAIAACAVWLLGRSHSALIDENYTAMKRLVAAWRILNGVWLPHRFEMSLPSFLDSSSLFAPDPPKIAGLSPDSEPEKYTRPKRLPSRVLVRHVLRLRLEAARELAKLLFELESRDAQINASFWLAEKFDGEVMKMSKTEEGLNEWERSLPRGVRGGLEVVNYLRKNGARLGGARVDDHWAASSGDDGEERSDESVADRPL
ncbi:MAG: hypothetical protein TREMPRED_001419 [Tremellales sp. Tagirdzhanova-0007]|nr:MAG: hypothetical protein TREMPRED_001419 [Tremellales sp. Tagirdzhanova-0007]